MNVIDNVPVLERCLERCDEGHILLGSPGVGGMWFRETEQHKDCLGYDEAEVVPHQSRELIWTINDFFNIYAEEA